MYTYILYTYMYIHTHVCGYTDPPSRYTARAVFSPNAGTGSANPGVPARSARGLITIVNHYYY